MRSAKDNRYFQGFISKIPASVIQYFNTLYYYFKAARSKGINNSHEPAWLSNTIDETLFSMDIKTGALTKVSASSEKLFGYTASEFMDDPQLWKSIILPADKHLIKENTTALLTNKIVSVEYRIIHKDATTRWIRSRLVALVNHKNELIRIDGLCRDITENKRTEESLKRSEANLRSVFNNTDMAYLLVDTDFRLISYNEQARKFALNPFNKILTLGDNVLDYIIPEKKAAYKKIMEEVLQCGNRSYEKSYRALDGFLKWYDIQLFDVPDEEEKIYALAVSIRDITKYKEAKQSIKMSEVKYRYLFDSNPAAILIWDIDDFNILEANETAVKLYGYTKEEFQQKTLLHLRPLDDCEQFLTALEALHAKDGRVAGRWRHVNKNGEIMYMDILAKKIMYGKKSLVVTIANNVTEKLHLENMLADQQMRRHYEITDAVITAQEQERTQLGEELHDNINQILATSSLYLDCALRNDERQMEMIANSKKFIMEAISEIRKLSKSLLPPSLGNKSLKETLQSLIKNVQQVQPLKFFVEWNLSNEEMVSEKLKLTIYRIVQEQLNNIFKHANASSVLIKIEQQQQTLIVTIKDDGKGFNIFEKRNGVGLQNIKSRTELLNGNISINSSPGNGCELILQFSIQEEYHEAVALLN